jgi:hypothetical protein
MPLFLLPLFRSLLSSLSLSFSFPVLPSLFYHSIVSLLPPYLYPFYPLPPSLLPFFSSLTAQPTRAPFIPTSQHPNTPRQNPTPTQTFKMVSVATQKKANPAVIGISAVLSGVNLIILLITLPYILRHYCKPTKKG